MTHPHQVTDQAVIRYLELVYGVPTDFFRNRLAVLAERGIKEGATGVIIHGVKLVIRDGRVITVIEKHRPSCDRRSRVLDAVLRKLKPTDPELAKLIVRRKP